MKELKILTVCGFGVGTSLLLKMNVQEVLKKLDIEADIEHVDLTLADSSDADLIFTSKELSGQLSNIDREIIVIDNFMDLNEISDKLQAYLRKSNKVGDL